jgi:KaiC/GvpD/RAD55 family RecA-like ATPase
MNRDEKEAEIKNFSEEVQRYLISVMISSEELFTRTQNIVEPKYFDGVLRPSIKYIKKFAEKYNTLPSPEQIKAETMQEFKSVDGITLGIQEWYIETIEEFCKYKALENAILAAPDRLERGAYGEVEKDIKEAILISLQKDLGTNYFFDPAARLKRLQDKEGMLATGWKAIDDKLFGGFTRGGLNIFAASSGVGKSLFLQNASLNWLEAGYNVVYITLELSELLTSMRIDSMLTDIASKSVLKNIDKVAMKVVQKGKSYGKFQIKYMNAGSTTNDIRAYLKEYQIQNNIRPDCIVVDYLDLISPNNKRINPSELFTKDKYSSEELRALANEWNAVLLTASQLNRSSIDEKEHNHSHIAGGLSKINTADNVMTIQQTQIMRDQQRFEVLFIKTRSSSGVGFRINLTFNPDTLRITNRDEDVPLTTGPNNANIAAQLRRETLRTEVAPSTTKTPEDAPIKNDTDLLKLMNKLNN